MSMRQFGIDATRWGRFCATWMAATAFFLLPGCSGGGSATRDYPLTSETRIIKAGDRATYAFSGELSGTATVSIRTEGDLIHLDTTTRFNSPGGPLEFSDTETYRQTDGDLFYKHINGFALEFPKLVNAATEFANTRRVCAEEDEDGVCLREEDEAYGFRVVGQETVTVPAGKFASWKVEVTQGAEIDTWFVAPQLGMFPVKAVTAGLTMTLQSFELK